MPTPSPWGWLILVSFGLKTTHKILGHILNRVCQKSLEFCYKRTSVKSELSETEASCHLHCSNLHSLIYVRNHCLASSVKKNYILHVSRFYSSFGKEQGLWTRFYWSISSPYIWNLTRVCKSVHELRPEMENRTIADQTINELLANNRTTSDKNLNHSWHTNTPSKQPRDHFKWAERL